MIVRAIVDQQLTRTENDMVERSCTAGEGRLNPYPGGTSRFQLHSNLGLTSKCHRLVRWYRRRCRQFRVAGTLSTTGQAGGIPRAMVQVRLAGNVKYHRIHLSPAYNQLVKALPDGEVLTNGSAL